MEIRVEEIDINQKLFKESQEENRKLLDSKSFEVQMFGINAQLHV